MVDLSRNVGPGGEIVCHNELSPCNVNFRDALPVAIINVDVASLGSRAHDLGYAAWLWLDFGNPEVQGLEQGRRLHLFAQAYGDIAPEVVLASMVKRQQLSIVQGERQGNRAMSAWATECLEWTRLHSSKLL